MGKREICGPSISVLTERLDVKSNEFDEFQAILFNKSKAQSKAQKLKIELMAQKFRMEDYLKSEEDDIVSAGEWIKSFLSIVEVRQNKFAKYIGLQPANLSKLIGGERPINNEIAIILGNIFNIDPVLWLSIQAKYELNKESETNKNKYKKYCLKKLISSKQ